MKKLNSFFWFMAYLVSSSSIAFLVMYFFGLIFFLTISYGSFPDGYKALTNFMVVIIGLAIAISNSIDLEE
jgi:hypothetical protein